MKTIRFVTLALAVALGVTFPTVAAQPPSRFVCAGAQPRFRLDVSREQVRFVPSGGVEQELLGSYAAEAKYKAFVWRGGLPGAEEQIVAFGIERSCQAAEEELPYTLLLSLPGGRLLQGCCKPAAGPVAGTADALSIGGLARISAADEPAALRSSPAVEDYNRVLELAVGEVVTVKGFRRLDDETWYLVERSQAEQGGWIRGAALEPVAMPDPGQDKEAGDWSRDVMYLMPAIEACLDEVSPDAPAVVTSALPLRMGMAAVRLRSGEGQRWYCVASLSAKRVSRVQEVPAGLEFPGDGDPLFTPSGGAHPPGGCWRHQEIVDPLSAKALGWLSYRQEGCGTDEEGRTRGEG